MRSAAPLMILGGMGVGTAAALVMDPRQGRRRRHQIGDRLVHSAHIVTDSAGAVTRDLSNRSEGILHNATAVLGKDDVSDPVLEARVRSRLGRVASHPSAISVLADHGRITLTGPVIADETERIVEGVSSVKGVKGVENRLQIHLPGEDVPGLQGVANPRRIKPGWQQEYWSPTARLLGGILGGGLMFRGLTGGGLLPKIAGLGGALLLTRSVTNMPLARVVGPGAGRQAVSLHKTMTLQAPVEEVFDLWSNFDNFPRFMDGVLEVRRGQQDWAHWTVKGPLGAPVSFNTQITKLVKNREIAWKTTPGSAIAHSGIVRFQSMGPGSTRLDIHMSYNPIAGLIGHAVATAFGANPKQTMDEDLARLKSLLESNKTTAHGKEVRAEEVVDQRRAAEELNS